MNCIIHNLLVVIILALILSILFALLIGLTKLYKRFVSFEAAPGLAIVTIVIGGAILAGAFGVCL